ncbi:threonine dehydratase [Fusarium tricinctum]|uniref:threonine ammonia-lyase n=1 Tax=Fusarium tricinctum TaxID=61284 RepID=A0A8K0RWS3_9HYPO|nr:threonine dehydratase [Fusarium tricinctum]
MAKTELSYSTQAAYPGNTILSTSDSRGVSGSRVCETNLAPEIHPDYVRLTVTSQVYDACKRTPLSVAEDLSNKLGYDVLLKRENEQLTFSCGLRGAYNMISQLDPAQSCKGIITCGTDGHAEAVARSARLLSIPAIVVMPEFTPMEVQARFLAMKSVIVLDGADEDAARDHCSKLAEDHGLIRIPTNENPLVIAGYGTIAWDILRQKDLSDTDALFCPLGDGGVIAGVGVFFKRMAPNVKIIGVQITTTKDQIQKPVANGKLVLPIRNINVKQIGKETLRLCHEVIDEIVQVTMDEACAAVKDVYEETRSFVDPFGASALAGLKKWTETNKTSSNNRSLIAVVDSASATFDQIRSVTERTTMHEGGEALLSIDIPNMPSSLEDLFSCLAPHVINEFVYRAVPGRTANVLVGLSLKAEKGHGQTQLQVLLSRIASCGMSAVDVSGDKLTASHIRYMAVRWSKSPDESVYAISFPGQSNALVKLLQALPPTNDVTLLQHNMSVGDTNTVIIGIKSPNVEFERSLDEMACSWQLCTEKTGFDAA